MHKFSPHKFKDHSTHILIRKKKKYSGPKRTYKCYKKELYPFQKVPMDTTPVIDTGLVKEETEAKNWEEEIAMLSASSRAGEGDGGNLWLTIFRGMSLTCYLLFYRIILFQIKCIGFTVKLLLKLP